MREFIPTIIVALGFAATLAVYVVLALNGTATGVLDELLLLEGGAVAGIAAPTGRRG